MRRRNPRPTAAAPEEHAFPALLDLPRGADPRAALDAARAHPAVAAAFEEARVDGARAIAAHYGRVGSLVARSLRAVSSSTQEARSARPR